MNKIKDNVITKVRGDGVEIRDMWNRVLRHSFTSVDVHGTRGWRVSNRWVHLQSSAPSANEVEK